MRFEFDWDPVKAASNLGKHDVSFDEAMSVFLDPLALSQLDSDGAPTEERWVTMGISRNTRLLLVIHTHAEQSVGVTKIRIISARKPTKAEVRQYENE